MPAVTSSKRRPLKRPNPSEVIAKDEPSDYTSESANERVFYLNMRYLRFGTTDKIQAAATLFALFLLAMIVLVIFAGLFSDKSQWLDKIFSWLGSAFLFLAGVAIGRSGAGRDAD
jgi:hypothetical protein